MYGLLGFLLFHLIRSIRVFSRQIPSFRRPEAQAPDQRNYTNSFLQMPTRSGVVFLVFVLSIIDLRLPSGNV
jgi:hypothetical protein